MNRHRFKSYLFLFFALHTGLAQAAYISITDASGNSSMAKAFNLDPKFTGELDKNIINPWDHSGTVYSHASAKAKTILSGTRDWYSFSTSKNNVKTFLDIDFATDNFRSWIGLYNAAGARIAFNDTGEVFDTGSKYPWDSFLFLTLAKPGRYYVAVGRDNNQPLLAGQNYTLNIGRAMSAQELAAQAPIMPSEVPVPAGFWLFGSAMAGLVAGVNKKAALRHC